MEKYILIQRITSEKKSVLETIQACAEERREDTTKKKLETAHVGIVI
jgi:DNA replication initiation complex subunit (GINS family)